MSGPKFVGGIANPNPILEGYQLTGAATTAFTAMVGSPIQVNLALPGNSAALTGDVSPTYSAATAPAYRVTWLRFSADGTARTVTLPYDHWSINRNGNITTLLVPANENLQVAIWYTGARWEIFNDPVATVGTGSFVKSAYPSPTYQHFEISFDPKAVCDGAVDRLFLFTVGDWAPNGIIFQSWKVSFEADPTTEADLDFKRADAFIGVGNAAVMDVCDTTNGAAGESTPANINGGATVATGKVVYLDFGTAYTETTHQIIFQASYVIV
jgi:hypothetical protein